MPFLPEDTIAAVATAPGAAAVSVIRVSGPATTALLSTVFRPVGRGKVPFRPEPRRATLGKVLDAAGHPLDEVLLTFFVGPRSYTGEDVAEFACHGGPLVTRLVLERILECGARAAEPGEFSRRAFLGGKMDLTQAEAVMDLITAKTELAVRAAQAQLSGGLGQRIEAARAAVLEIVAHVEAWIDFPEEDIDPVTGALLQEKIAVVRSRIDGLLATADRGRILREGLRTVICGAPNVGKSSLLNRLLGYDRAIVSDVAGTTRDTIEEIINLRGIPLRLIDTAGLRESDDVLEQAGMARTLRQLDQAELVIHVVDASRPRGAGSDAPQVMAGTQVLTVLNKADLGRHLDWEAVSGFPFSCATGEGEDALVEAIFRLTGQTQAQWEGECVAISVRHRDALRRAGEGLDAAAALLEANAAGELAALELREALDALGEIVGRLDIEDILGEIFGRFCIGK